MNRNPIDQTVTRVLVIVEGGLGDVAMAMSPLAAIRTYHAAAEITVLTQPCHAALFQRCPHVDRIDIRLAPRFLRNRVQTAWSQRQVRYGAVYDLANSAASNAVFARLRPYPPLWNGIAIGCSHPHADRDRLNLHVLDRHAEQIWLAGIGPEEGYPAGGAPLPDLSWHAQGSTDPDRYTPARQGITGPYALLAPEGPPEAPSKRWPSQRYAELAHALVARGIRPVLVGTPAAAGIATQVRAEAPEVLDLVARLTTFEFLGLARRAALAFGSEGDLAITAAAAGAPTVALINPNESSPRKAAPRGRASVALVARKFADIAVGQVLRAARAVEQAGPAESP